MGIEELSEFIAMILAAGGPREQLARVRWPLHLALCEIYEQTGRTGERSLLGHDLVLRGSSEVGVEVVGADRALDHLVQRKILRPEGQLREARLILDDGVAVELRRQLMTLPPE